MSTRQRFGATLAMVAMLTLASPFDSSFAAVCSPPGEIVISDPSGDGPTTETDILDVAIQEVVAGPHTGKFIVTMHVSSLGSTPSGMWIVGWEDVSGNNHTTLAMTACAGVPSFTYEYSTPEGTESGSPDGGSYTANGAIEWIIARDKIGNPSDGQTFEQITGITILWVPLDPLPGCIPQGGSDGTPPGQYVVGSCLVDAPGARSPVALRLGLPGPNPARSEVSLALDVPANMAGHPFEVAVFDMAGRRQNTIASGRALPGRTLLRWDLRNARGDHVRPGTYWARVTVGEEQRAQTVLVVR